MRGYSGSSQVGLHVTFRTLSECADLTVMSPRLALGVDQLCSCQDRCTWQPPWLPELACAGLDMSATPFMDSRNPAEARHLVL